MYPALWLVVAVAPFEDARVEELAQPETAVSALIHKLYSKDILVVADAERKLSRFQGEAADIRAVAAALSQYRSACETFAKSIGTVKDWGLHIESREPIDLQKMKLIYPHRRVSNLLVKSPHFTDEHLGFLNHFEFTSLGINGCPVTGKGFSNLKLPEVSSLDLQNCPVDDNGILAARFPKLTVLWLCGTKITDRSLREYPTETLAQLEIRRTAVTSAGLLQLDRFERLSDFSVDLAMLDEKVLDAILKGTLKLPKLSSIKIGCRKEEVLQAERLRERLKDRCHVKIAVE